MKKEDGLIFFHTFHTFEPFIHLNLPPTKGCGDGYGSLCVGVFVFLYVCVSVCDIPLV